MTGFCLEVDQSSRLAELRIKSSVSKSEARISAGGYRVWESHTAKASVVLPFAMSNLGRGGGKKQHVPFAIVVIAHPCLVQAPICSSGIILTFALPLIVSCTSWMPVASCSPSRFLWAVGSRYRWLGNRHSDQMLPPSAGLSKKDRLRPLR